MVDSTLDVTQKFEFSLQEITVSPVKVHKSDHGKCVHKKDSKKENSTQQRILNLKDSRTLTRQLSAPYWVNPGCTTVHCTVVHKLIYSYFLYFSISIMFLL